MYKGLKKPETRNGCQPVFCFYRAIYRTMTTSTETKTIQKKSHGMVPLVIVGVVASFVFAFNVVAAGMTPAEVIALANSARAKADLPALRENSLLAEAAKNKANDMIKNDYFAHTSPKGVEPWVWIKDTGYQYRAAGENLAINYTDATDQHEAWMKSETHRANILSNRYQEIGVAVTKGKIDGKESILTVEFFAAPLGAIADQTKSVPVVPVTAPVAVKGSETTVLPVVEPSSLVNPEEASVLPVAIPTQSDILSENRRLDAALLVAAILFLLSMLTPPAIFVTRGYRALRYQSKHDVLAGLEQLDIHKVMTRS